MFRVLRSQARAHLMLSCARAHRRLSLDAREKYVRADDKRVSAIFLRDPLKTARRHAETRALPSTQAPGLGVGRPAAKACAYLQGTHSCSAVRHRLATYFSMYARAPASLPERRRTLTARQRAVRGEATRRMGQAPAAPDAAAGVQFRQTLWKRKALPAPKGDSTDRGSPAFRHFRSRSSSGSRASLRELRVPSSTAPPRTSRRSTSMCL